jgi:KaiC/GvpD/RAD55 family RecA-like ATPase
LEAAGEAVHFSDELQPVVEYVRSYYTEDGNATSVDPGLLREAVVNQTRDPKRQELLDGIVTSLVQSDPSVPNARKTVREIAAKRVGEKLATKLLLPSPDGPDALELIQEFVELRTGGDANEDRPQWSQEAIAPALQEPRVPIFPRSLGDRLRGGLWPGHHMTVFARPEVGKTAFALSVAVMAASKGKSKVLYLSNEDSVRDLMLRALVLFNRCSVDQVLADLGQAIDTARRYGADRLVFRDMAPGSLAEVEKHVRKHKPDLTIVDQMRNIGVGKSAENMTQRLDVVMQGLRNIGKRNECAVLSLTQAGDSARDKATLDDGDVDYSNTGVPAGCDVLIGIGCTPAMRDAGERRLSVIKNKPGGWHGYADVRLDPLTLAIRDYNT